MGPLSGKSLQGIIPLFAGLGTVVQLLVLLALCVASLVCWGIIVHKTRLLRKARQDDTNFLLVFRAGNDLAFLAAAARRFAFSPLARVFRTIHQQIEVSSNGRRPTLESELPALSSVSPERLRHMLQLRRSEEMARLEKGLPFLATTASMTPFIGLFGTVWGIMQAFHAIGQGSGASLAVVGPGISEALIATAAGLAAAIPAGIAYNHYLHRLRRIETNLESFAEEVVQLFEVQPAPDRHRSAHRTSLQR